MRCVALTLLIYRNQAAVTKWCATCRIGSKGQFVHVGDGDALEVGGRFQVTDAVNIEEQINGRNGAVVLCLEDRIHLGAGLGREHVVNPNDLPCLIEARSEAGQNGDEEHTLEINTRREAQTRRFADGGVRVVLDILVDVGVRLPWQGWRPSGCRWNRTRQCQCRRCHRIRQRAGGTQISRCTLPKRGWR